MSILLDHSLADATAMIRGELCPPNRVGGFAVDGLTLWQLFGIEAAPGHSPLDSDSAWEAVVRGWWGLGLTWGLCIVGKPEGVAWNLVLPPSAPAVIDSVASHIAGARMENSGEFSQIAARLQKLPFRAAMAGHNGMGPTARIESAIRSMVGREFIFLMLAKATSRQELEEEIHRLGGEEQFLRDEHLSRPGLEHDSHPGATRYLSLVEAARERAISALQEGGWQVRVMLATSSESDFRQAQSLIHSGFAADGGSPEPLRWQDPADPRSLTFLRSAEVAALSRPPLRELPGFIVETTSAHSSSRESSVSPVLFATTARNTQGQPAISIGRILDDGGQPREWLDIETADLCRHVLIAGMTGAGKTTTCEHLLLELWREHKIPWLVIEPGMKAGYRRLLNSEIGSDIAVWAIGTPNARRLPMNPMAAPAGVGVAEHTSGLFAVISSAFELVPPMPEVLATAIEQTYRNHGWSLAGRVPEGPSPTLDNLIEEIDRTTRAIGYGPEITGNIRAGLILRLKRLTTGPLAPELASAEGLNFQSLVTRPTIIELSSVPDADSQALVLGFLMLQLRHHWRLSGTCNLLRHVTLIEEAHRLLRAVPENSANATRARAVEDMANMLAELRAFGAGLAVVEQTPSALAPSVIANTGTKILHRLDHPSDRELAGRAAGIPADQVDLLGTLGVGQAILRSARRQRPFRLRIPNPAVTYGKLPLPELPARADVESAKYPAKCPICGCSECPAEAAGNSQALISDQLISLQAALQGGEDATWDWAVRQVKSDGIEHTSSSAPLCFLIAVGRTAKLSNAILQRLRSAFEPRIRKSSL